MDFVGNHCMAVQTDGESYERVLLFGGISNTIKGGGPTPIVSPTSKRDKKKLQDATEPTKPQDMNLVSSFLSNRCFVINV